MIICDPCEPEESVYALPTKIIRNDSILSTKQTFINCRITYRHIKKQCLYYNKPAKFIIYKYLLLQLLCHIKIFYFNPLLPCIQIQKGKMIGFIPFKQ
jgi:hypothetical protein